MNGGSGGSRVLEAEHVFKVFYPKGKGRPPTEALRDVSVDVREGEFLVLLGASGCGKTTLLRLFAGLEKPTRGSVRLMGQLVTKPTSQAALVFQNPVLLPWRTILENVMLPVEIRRANGPQYRERAMALLTMMGLENFVAHYPRELSGGMRQRAAICRALVLDPPILFMDEPYGALDAITRSGLNRELWETWKRVNKTIVFVTHDMTEAARLATRVVIMSPRPGQIAKVIDMHIPGETYDERLASREYVEALGSLERQLEEATDLERLERLEVAELSAQS